MLYLFSSFSPPVFLSKAPVALGHAGWCMRHKVSAHFSKQFLFARGEKTFKARISRTVSVLPEIYSVISLLLPIAPRSHLCGKKALVKRLFCFLYFRFSEFDIVVLLCGQRLQCSKATLTPG